MMIERLLIVVAVTLVALAVTASWRYLRAGQMAAIATEEESVRGFPTLLYFWSEACAPCRYQQAPIVERLAEELAGKVATHKVDAIADSALAARYGVMSVPTIVIITSQGRVIARNTGVASAEALHAQLETAGR
jgi:thioredoxin 1